MLPLKASHASAIHRQPESSRPLSEKDRDAVLGAAADMVEETLAALARLASLAASLAPPRH